MPFLEKINSDLEIGALRYLYKHIVQTIVLPDFVESEVSEDIQWLRPELSARCCCPLHEENVKEVPKEQKDGEKADS